MRSPSLAPSRDPVHLVMCDFGRMGLAYVETPPVMSEHDVIAGMLRGEYDNPVEVVAFSPDEGWARNVSEDIAGLVVESARAARHPLSPGAQAFVEKHLDEELEPELCA
jgi:hypothetical protein